MRYNALQLVLAILTSSAISVGMLAYGFKSRRADGSRRIIFAVGGVIGCLLTIPIGFLTLEEIGDLDAFAILMVCVLCLIVSFFLLRRGIRGRQIGDHPHCRRCGFDLFGKPETSQQCSECGADIHAPKAIVIGVRHRSATKILLGIFFLLVSFGAGVPIGWNYRSLIDLNAYKPDWWLMMQWDPSSSSFSSPAMNELLARLSSGKLSDSARQSMLKKIIATGLPANPWTPALLASAEKRAMDQSQLRSIVRLNCSAIVTVEPEIPIGRAIPCVTIVRPVYQTASTRVTMRVLRDEINDVQLLPSSRHIRSSNTPLIPSFQMDQELLDLGALWQMFAPNSNDVTLKWKREIEINVSFRNGSQTLVESSTITVTKELIAQDSSLFASEITEGPWHVTLRRAGDNAWIDIDPDDAFLEGQTVAMQAKMSSRTDSYERSIGSILTNGSMTSSLAISSRKLPNDGGLRLQMYFPRSFVKSQPGVQTAFSSVTAPIADPGRKLADEEFFDVN